MKEKKKTGKKELKKLKLEFARFQDQFNQLKGSLLKEHEKSEQLFKQLETSQSKASELESSFKE